MRAFRPASQDGCGRPAVPKNGDLWRRADPLLRLAPAGLCGGLKDRGDAEPLFAKGCGGGDMEGCSRLAFFYQCGVGVARDPRRAFTLATEACERGYASACADAGAFVAQLPDRTAADVATGARALEKGCAAGDRNSCFNLGIAVLSGHATPAQAKMVLAFMARTCDAGDAEACGEEASFYVTGATGVGADYARAVKVGEPACAKNDAGACNAVGLAYLNGYGGPKEVVQAALFFDRACQAQNPPACDNLGVMYAQGIGVGVDALHAEQLFRKACDAGNPPGCTHLATVLATSPSAPVPVGTASSP